MPVRSACAPMVLVERRDERVGLVRAQLAGDAGALVAGDVEAGEPPDAVGNRRVIRRGEPERGQVEVVVRRVRVGAADEPVVAVAHVQNRGRVEQRRRGRARPGAR